MKSQLNEGQWDMKFMPISETLESQQEKKDKLKILSEQATFCPEEVKTLMKDTYFSQRKAINSGTDLQSLMEEWPFLFKEIGMIVHFHDLTGVSLKETFLSNVEKKRKTGTGLHERRICRQEQTSFAGCNKAQNFERTVGGLLRRC